MRDFQLVVPSDCIASESEDLNGQALGQLRMLMQADTTPSSELDLRETLRQASA